MVFPGALALRGRPIGLLGGSFNPAHAGHLYISRVARQRLRLDQVWWLVSPQNPLKTAAGMAPLADRLATARAVAKADPAIRVTAIERDFATRYTVDTVTRLQAAVPGAKFVWLMGADNLRQISQWRRWPTIFRRLPVAVIARGTHDFPALAAPAAQRFAWARLPATAAPHLAQAEPPAWLFLPIRHHPASATKIRSRALTRTH